MNKSFIKFLKELCRLPTEKVFEVVRSYADQEFDADHIVQEPKFLYIKGDIPICLVAHIDTVHDKVPTEFYRKTDKVGRTYLSSPEGIGGDDRCGIFLLLMVMRSKLRPHFLFLDEEERGGRGAQSFVDWAFRNNSSPVVNCFVEFDRQGERDVVQYSDMNKELVKVFTSTFKYKEAYGTFTDISILCPSFKISGVNLSCGYYYAHSLREMICLEDLDFALTTVLELCSTEALLSKVFLYEDRPYRSSRFSRNPKTGLLEATPFSYGKSLLLPEQPEEHKQKQKPKTSRSTKTTNVSEPSLVNTMRAYGSNLCACCKWEEGTIAVQGWGLICDDCYSSYFKKGYTEYYCAHCHKGFNGEDIEDIYCPECGFRLELL